MILDPSEFLEGIDKLDKVVTRKAEEGLIKAAEQALLDADTIEPKTPHLAGDLRGSKFILEPVIDAGVLTILFGFTMPYAAKWHEAEGKNINWSEQGVGAKYLESKLTRYGKKYLLIVCFEIKGGLDAKV